MSDAPSLFDGIPVAKLERELKRLERRRLPPGTELIGEGERTARELYVVQSGGADVFTADRHGKRHLLSHAGPGATLGEMALLTGEPASATVIAAEELELLVLGEPDFRRIAGRFPRVYQNLGSILAERLARTNRQAADREPGRVTLLLTHDAPPLLGYALACSLAWHTHGPILHLILTEDAPAELTALGTRWTEVERSGQSDPRAVLLIAAPAGQYAPAALAGTLYRLCERFDHVVVQVPAATPPNNAAHTVYLRGAHEPDTSVLGAQPGHTVRGWSAAGAGMRPDQNGVLQVSAPSRADEDAIQTGTLPPSTPLGQALGWLARDLAGLKVGLALGGGAVKGYAHIGVLGVLDGLGIPVDYIAGTSIGAAVAAFYAAGFGVASAPTMMDEIGSAAFRLAFSTNSLLSNGALRSRLRRALGERTIQGTAVPLAIVAADINSHQEVIFRRGLIWPALLASMAIPGIYPPVRMGNYTLVDGGVLNPVPGNVVAAMGADVVIAVKLASRPTTAGAEVEAVLGDKRATTVLQAITGAVELMQTKIIDSTAASSTIVIEPVFQGVDGFGLRNFSQGNRFIALGQEATENARPHLAAALPWLR